MKKRTSLASTAGVALKANALASLAVAEALGRALGVVVSIVPVVSGPGNIKGAGA